MLGLASRIGQAYLTSFMLMVEREERANCPLSSDGGFESLQCLRGSVEVEVSFVMRAKSFSEVEVEVQDRPETHRCLASRDMVFYFHVCLAKWLCLAVNNYSWYDFRARRVLNTMNVCL